MRAGLTSIEPRGSPAGRDWARDNVKNIMLRDGCDTDIEKCAGSS